MGLKKDIIEMGYKGDMSLNHIKKYVHENCIAPKDKIFCFTILTSPSLDEYTKYLFCLQHLLEGLERQNLGHISNLKIE